MKAEYDFSKARRGQAVPTKGKTRITIYIDDTIVAAFKAKSTRAGIGYQTLIKRGARTTYRHRRETDHTEQVREIVRDQLAHAR